MRDEILSYFSDGHISDGLLVAEAPTGYGKTYETVQAIYRYIRNGGKRQILFITNLLKNLPVSELEHAYILDGKADHFTKEVLCLKATAVAVEEAILSVKIPFEFQTDAYHNLLSACLKKQDYSKQASPPVRELLKILDENIRCQLEPAFRHELEAKLRKKFPQGPHQRRDAIRNNKQYQWMAQFYPAVFWPEYKIILMSTQKLLAKNITLVEPSFDFLSDRMLKNKIVCIDEFDASRAVVLDTLIEEALNLQANYIELYLQIYRGITTHQIAENLKQIRNSYQVGRTTTWESLLQLAKGIYEDNALHYSIKTVGSGSDTRRNFLFHDTSYHTVLDAKRTHIRAVRNDDQSQIQIHFETKEEYDAHCAEPRITIQHLLRQIHVFLLRFQRYVYGWAEAYAKQVNSGKKHDEDLYTIAAAAESIYREYGLSPDQAHLMMGDLNDNGAANRNLITPDLSFYETGFRLFEFIDDDLHRTKTYLQYLQMQNTPEKVLLYLCRRAKVIGLSATAALPTVLGNYDLKYLKEQLQGQYRELSDTTKEKIRQELETFWKPYQKNTIQVKLQVVDLGQAHLPLSERLENIFACPATARIYARRLDAMGVTDNYIQQRYCNIFTAMKAFWTYSEIHSFLCLNQLLPNPGKPEMDEELLSDVLNALRREIAPLETGSITVLRSGEQFDADKAALLQALEDGEKRFILSSYQTLGAGQNLQYVAKDRSGLVSLNAPRDENDSRFQKKDMDALYLGDVTNVTVNLFGDNSLDRADLIKYCFQAECLYENDEISYRTLTSLLKDGIGCFSGKRPANSVAQRTLKQSASVHGQITRDVIQAVGRVGRTFLKRPYVYLFTTEKALSDLDPSCLENRLLSPEMQKLYDERAALGQTAQTDTLLHEAERKATRGNRYINQMLSIQWTEDSMKLWKTLRQTLLCHPRAGTALWNQDPVIRTYYIPLAENKYSYFFAQKGDFAEVTLSLDQDKAVFAASLPKGISPSQVSEEEARLPLILSYPGMKNHFAENGWATGFGNGTFIMSPVLFQNIYKGALGEVAGRFILQRELNLSLCEIDDPAQFEVFDFVTTGGLYFDFKHWKKTTQMNDTTMRNKILAKLDVVGGRRVFIINLISDGTSIPTCTCDKRLIEIPGLLLPDGQPDWNALNYIGRFLL